MISILILTNDIPVWEQKIRSCLHITKSVKGNNSYYMENPMFVIDIKNEYLNECKRKRYSNIIIDKLVSEEFEYKILKPLAKSSIIKTKNYMKLLCFDSGTS